MELVSVKAKAGYTAGYADPGFIGKLPSYHFPFLPKEKTHRAFQISGDSMLYIIDKSWIICEYIENRNNIKNGVDYVIITKDDGIVFKRVYNRIKENKALLLVSLNAIYQPYEIKIESVLEVWKFAIKFSEVMVEE